MSRRSDRLFDRRSDRFFEAFLIAWKAGDEETILFCLKKMAKLVLELSDADTSRSE